MLCTILSISNSLSTQADISQIFNAVLKIHLSNNNEKIKDSQRTDYIEVTFAGLINLHYVTCAPIFDAISRDDIGLLHMNRPSICLSSSCQHW
jgi:hypothetical protein